MTLSEYLIWHKETPHAFATRIAVAPSSISRLLNGTRKAGKKLRDAIYLGTSGKVTFNDLYDLPSQPHAKRAKL